MPRQAMNTALHQDEAELGVLILAVLVQVLADRHRLLDQEVEVLRQAGRDSIGPGVEVLTRSIGGTSRYAGCGCR